MKRLLTLLLVLCLTCGLLAGCGGKKAEETPKVETEDDADKNTNTPADQNEQPTVEDDGVLKILMIGHSLGMDSFFLLPEVLKNENAGPAVIGMIYHSGCRLGQHVDYLTQDAAQYAYYEYDTTKDNEWLRADCSGEFFPYIPNTPNDTFIEDGSIAQTMAFGIGRHDWDIVATQAGVFEAADKQDGAYAPNFQSDIKTVLDYVLANDVEKGSVPKFAWNITWTCPSDEMLSDSYRSNLSILFGGDADAMYEAIAATAKDQIASAHNWDYIVPSGTAMQNARSSVFTPKDLYRDTIHASDFGRLIVAYTWYCALTGADINTCQFGPVNTNVLVTDVLRLQKLPFEMTEQQKNVLVESVTNALANPYAMTQSQYTG